MSVRQGGGPPSGRLARGLDAIRERLWVLPALLGVAAAVAAEALVRLDRLLDQENARPLWVFSGNADAARSVLSTVATATMTVLGVTLSITLAVFALTAQGYSPRALRRFVRDRVIQAVIGGFVGAFVFALVALRLVREDEVPGVTVNVAVLLAFVVIGLLVAFFHHMASEIRVERLIEVIWEETRAAIPRIFPDGLSGDASGEPGAPRVAEVRATLTGRVRWIDDGAIAGLARGLGGTVVVVPGPGDLVADGEAVMRVHGGRAPDPDEEAALRAAVRLGTQRTMSQDAAFGLRQLTDIALRALSPGINDPTTAEEAILRTADLLRRLAGRELGVRVIGDDGRVLLVRERPGWDDLVGIAFDQCASAAEAQADEATMLVLLDAIARVLASTDVPDRLEPLRHRARRIRDGAGRALPDPAGRGRVEAAAGGLV